MRKIYREGKYGPRRRRKNRQIFGPVETKNGGGKSVKGNISCMGEIKNGERKSGKYLEKKNILSADEKEHGEGVKYS